MMVFSLKKQMVDQLLIQPIFKITILYWKYNPPIAWQGFPNSLLRLLLSFFLQLKAYCLILLPLTSARESIHPGSSLPFLIMLYSIQYKEERSAISGSLHILSVE